MLHFGLDVVQEQCFRPLAGIMVLIVMHILIMLLRHIKRFRPLAGIMVLIHWGESQQRSISGSWGFRPLAGIMVLILSVVGEDNYELARFPSPCGDYGSYLLSQ